MRYTIQTFLSAMLIFGGSQLASGAESGSWWWPFGGDGAAKSHEAAPPAAKSETASSWMKMPSMPGLKSTDGKAKASSSQAHAKTPNKTSTPRPRNSWAESDVAPKTNTPWQSVKNGAHSVSQTTKKAWHKTVDAVTPGDSETPHVAQRETPKKSWFPSIWGSEDKNPEGSRTIGEFMSQPRPGQ